MGLGMRVQRIWIPRVCRDPPRYLEEKPFYGGVAGALPALGVQERFRSYTCRLSIENFLEAHGT